MQKSVKLAINAFPQVPTAIQHPSDPKKAVDHLNVDLADLYHHYYLNSWDRAPPDPDPVHFEQVRYLLPCADFRFQRGGMGANKTFKGNKSNELGEAFCRWFLDKALGIAHVAPIDAVRDYGALADHGGISVESDTDVTGDAPDFFCAEADGSISLAEAKGTRHAVGFTAKEFQRWRNQFKRVRVLDAHGQPMSVKGYIVAMRWATEKDSARTFTKLSAEDPRTPGERPFFDERGGFAAAVRSLHYAPTLRRLRQPILSTALAHGSVIPDELQFQVVIWESFLPQLKGLRFVGGYFPSDPEGGLPFYLKDGKAVMTPRDPFRLDIGSGTFVGVEQTIFKTLVSAARIGPTAINDLRLLDPPDTGYSGASLLRDGHVLGPIELFRPVEVTTF